MDVVSVDRMHYSVVIDFVIMQTECVLRGEYGRAGRRRSCDGGGHRSQYNYLHSLLYAVRISRQLERFETGK